MKVTILGIWEYLNNENLSLFDSLQLPEDLDADVTKNTILARCGEFGSVWSNPYFVRNMVGVWSGKNLANWSKMAAALAAEYDPLHNYDRIEEWTDTGSEESSGSSTNTETHNRTDTETRNLASSGTSTTTGSDTHDTNNNVTTAQSAFDHAIGTPVIQDVVRTLNDEDNTHTETVQASGTDTGTDTETHTGTVGNSGTTSGNVEKESSHTGRMYGNIGVTTSQQMLESEIDLRSRINLYDMIAESFMKEFCIMVY